MKIRVIAAARVPLTFGGYCKKGEVIKEINPDNVIRFVADGGTGDVTFYYRNGLHEVYNANMVRIEIEKGEQA